MLNKSHEIDMLHGPLAGKILLFSLPLMFSGILQLLFNAADLVVVGKYAGDECLAAVGATGSLTNLIVNAFIGLAVGVNVVVARDYGAGEKETVSRSAHTAILLSLICGGILVVIGQLVARPMLVWMDTPPDVLDLAVKYMSIIFVGMPFSMLYNFGSAILRTIGDTRRPMYFLLISGILNVLLNLFFVIVLGMDVDGVALATILSQALSASLVLISLMRMDGPCRISLRKLRLHKEQVLEIMRVGLPAGLQGCIFSISNVLIQSSINGFQTQAMAGSTAASNLEGFVYTCGNSVYQAALSFTSQNYGARKFKRINKVLVNCIVIGFLAPLAVGALMLLFKRQLLSFYTDEAAVVEFGVKRMNILILTYCLCGIMDVMTGMMRGIGYSVLPMIVSLTGACGLRIVWIYTLFAAFPTLENLYLSYPVSWIVTFLILLACFLTARRRLPPTDADDAMTANGAQG